MNLKNAFKKYFHMRLINLTLNGQIFLRTVILFTVCLPFCIAQAQEINRADLENAKNKLQLEREVVFIEALHLTMSQASVFHLLYLDFDKEKRKLDDSFIKYFVKYAANYESLDHKIMHRFIRESNEHQQKELKLRRKYFKKLSKSISPQLASQFYEVDDFTSTVLRLNILMSLPFTGNILQGKE